MKLQIIKFKCGSCGEWFESPEIDEFAYGEFLMRSGSGEIRYLNANLDEVFKEVDSILETDSRFASLDKFQKADVLHSIFGIACDRDCDNEYFQIGAKPPCPRCAKQMISEWVGTNPLRYVDIDLIPISHDEWINLDGAEKRFRLSEAFR